VSQGSGFGFRVSGFGFRVSGFGSRVSGFGFTGSSSPGAWFQSGSPLERVTLLQPVLFGV